VQFPAGGEIDFRRFFGGKYPGDIIQIDESQQIGIMPFFTVFPLCLFICYWVLLSHLSLVQAH
jgi:hypothetical protein